MSAGDIQPAPTPADPQPTPASRVPRDPTSGDIRHMALAHRDEPDGIVLALVYIGDVLATSLTAAVYDLSDQIRGR